MTTRFLKVLVFFATLCLPALRAFANCSDTACSYTVEAGSYEIMLPNATGNPLPVVMYLHGYGSKGSAVMKATHVSGTMLTSGYAVIAPDALRRDGDGPTSWGFHPDFPSVRNEADFFASVLADASSRYDLDTTRVLLAGFSIGGSMAAYIACDHPELFSAYAPIGGNFWRPYPDECQGPVRMFHTHGWRDRTVPLEGRTVGSGITQGDVHAVLQIWRQTNGCANDAADEFAQTGVFLRRSWTDCVKGSALEFALFPGGHNIPKGWADMILTWFETPTGSGKD